MKRIAIVGASGFVGAALFEEILRLGKDEPVPLIHSSGNAWQVARHGVALQSVNLLDKPVIARALSGCTHVVNCSRGGNEVMLRGLSNLLEVAKTTGIRRVVHLSSVMVYGDPPHPDSTCEDAPTEPVKGSYGWVKLQQDRMIDSAAKSGLPSVVLCPPNISGPNSAFLLGLLDAVRTRQFALVESGKAVCNLVDVRNLVSAILLALDSEIMDGRRLFVTDGEDITWGQIIAPLCSLAEVKKVSSVERDELIAMREAASQEPQKSISRALKHLVSSEVRQAMRADPIWKSFDDTLRSAVGFLGQRLEGRLRLSIEGPMRVKSTRSSEQLNLQLCGQQLRGIRHSCDRAQSQLGYRPRVGFERSMFDFSEWYRSTHGIGEAFWDLRSKLYV